jgi:anti-sigma regulatory factor (Ser/Thr protein kinase)
LTFSLSIRNTLAALTEAQERANSFLSGHGVPFEAAYSVRLSLEELVSNIIRHGYDDREPHEIGIWLEILPRVIELTIDDDGRPFDPNSAQPVPVPASLDDAPTGGMGLSLVRTIAGPIEYQRQGGRNRVTLRIPT